MEFKNYFIQPFMRVYGLWLRVRHNLHQAFINRVDSVQAYCAVSSMEWLQILSDLKREGKSVKLTTRVKSKVCLFIYKRIMTAIFAVTFNLSRIDRLQLLRNSDCWFSLWDMSVAFSQGRIASRDYGNFLSEDRQND